MASRIESLASSKESSGSSSKYINEGKFSENAFAKFQSTFRAYQRVCTKRHNTIGKQDILHFDSMLDISIFAFRELHGFFSALYDERVSKDREVIQEYEETQEGRVHRQMKQARTLETVMYWHHCILIKWDENLQNLRKSTREMRWERYFQNKLFVDLEKKLDQAENLNEPTDDLKREWEDEYDNLWILERNVKKKKELVAQLSKVVQKGWSATREQDEDLMLFSVKLYEVNKGYKKIEETDIENRQRGGTREAKRDPIVVSESGQLYPRDLSEEIPLVPRSSLFAFRRATRSCLSSPTVSPCGGGSSRLP